MAAKIAPFANEVIFSCKVAYLIGFDLLRTKICVINTFGEQILVKKRLKLEKFKIAAKTGSAEKVERNSLIGLHLTSIT